MACRGRREKAIKVSSDEGLKDFRTAQPSNFSRVELRNLMRYLVAVFRGGLSWNCVALLRPVGRASRFRCLRKQRNYRKRVRLSMFRIPSTRFLSRLLEWNFRDCSGFDAERPETEDRTSRRPRTLLLQIKT